jgi:acetoin reductase-like protein
MMKLKGKVALVTGGGSGIGRGICHRFARDHADVVVNDIDMKSAEKVSRELESFGAKSLGICADVSLKSSVEKMVSRVIKEWNKIDILVNCAGIARITPLMETTEEEFDRVYQVNLKGVFLCTQIVAKEMMKQGGGKIINVSSLAGRRPAEFLAAYGATKFGVIGLTQSTALELARYGITCNAVAPGVIDTPLSTLRDKREAEIRGVEKIDTLARGVKNVPLGRAGQPEDIANVVSFLASSDADYVNGQTINVCGGLVFS